MLKRDVLISALIELAVCLLGVVALSMTLLSYDDLAPLIGLPPGGEVILIYPCMGWTLFSSLPVAYYAVQTHMSVSRLGYMELMRRRTYVRWRLVNYARAARLCLEYTVVALVFQMLMGGEKLVSALISAGLFLMLALMLCAVFQWAYLRTTNGEKVLVMMICLNAVGTALGYVWPKASAFMPVSWAMLARSGLRVDEGYAVGLVLALEATVILMTMLSNRHMNVSTFTPRNQEK